MGQDISATHFTADDTVRFTRRLAAETRLASALFAQGGFARSGRMAGYELEAWLVDRNGFPVACNQRFLARMADPRVVAELSRFNIELNGAPQALAGHGLSCLEEELNATWAQCLRVAHEEQATAIAIGTLPTLRDADLDLTTMTPAKRYMALNRQVCHARQGRPLLLDIAAPETGGAHLRTAHNDVMLEAATTSFQVHLQVPAQEIARHLNASMLLSGPLVALSANSPFLFGRRLWHETRIPLFEQAVDCGGDPAQGQRVSFGTGYLGADPTSYFADNADRYPVLLPLHSDSPPESFSHLRLHNGTVWRWNRLLIGHDAQGTPHLRIEQRVMPAGPSLIDMMANAAFYYGAVHALAHGPAAPQTLMPFTQARDNFYRAAQEGLDAPMPWPGTRPLDAASLLKCLLPMAREGLQDLGVATSDIDRYLDVVSARLRTRRNGAAWQRAHHARYGDLFKLTADYAANQRSGRPVHEWPI